MMTGKTLALGLALAMIASTGWTGFAQAEPPRGPARPDAIDLTHTPEFPALSQPGVSLAPLPGPAVPAAPAPRLPAAPALGLGPVDATIGLPAAREAGAPPLPEGRVGLGWTNSLLAPAGSTLRLEAARPLDLGLSRLSGDPKTRSEADGRVTDPTAPRLSFRGEVPAGQGSALSLEAHETMRARAEEAERQVQLRLRMGW